MTKAAIPDDGAPTVADLVVPVLAVGLPALLLVGLVALQVATGAAWLPVVRRVLGTASAWPGRRRS